MTVNGNSNFVTNMPECIAYKSSEIVQTMSQMAICTTQFQHILYRRNMKSILNVSASQGSVSFIAGVHERPHIYTLMQTHINPEMTAIRPISLLLPHHHKSVPGEKRVGNPP